MLLEICILEFSYASHMHKKAENWPKIVFIEFCLLVGMYVDLTQLRSQKFFLWWFWYKYPSYTSELCDGPLCWLSILHKSRLSETAWIVIENAGFCPSNEALILDPSDAVWQNVNFLKMLNLYRRPSCRTEFKTCQLTNQKQEKKLLTPIPAWLKKQHSTPRLY